MLLSRWNTTVRSGCLLGLFAVACPAPASLGTRTATLQRGASSGSVPAQYLERYEVRIEVFETPWGGPGDLPCSCQGEIEGLTSISRIDAQPCDDRGIGCGFGVNGDKTSPDFLEGAIEVTELEHMTMELANPWASPAWTATYEGQAQQQVREDSLCAVP
jgi:hypothetical protein